MSEELLSDSFCDGVGCVRWSRTTHLGVGVIRTSDLVSRRLAVLGSVSTSVDKSGFRFGCEDTPGALREPSSFVKGNSHKCSSPDRTPSSFTPLYGRRHPDSRSGLHRTPTPSVTGLLSVPSPS